MAFNLRILSTGSKGNCYILGNDEESIILEAGINWNTVKSALNYNFENIKAVIISHRHL